MEVLPNISVHRNDYSQGFIQDFELGVGNLLMQSGTRLLFNTCDKTIITILNFKISWGGGGGGGGELQPRPPLYETLCNSLSKELLNSWT